MTTSNHNVSSHDACSTFPTIDGEQLVTATGGDGDDSAVCTFDNPSGAPAGPTQFFENNYSGPSTEQRVIQNTDRAMAPWNAFNGIFGGLGAGAPRQGDLGSWRPQIQ